MQREIAQIFKGSKFYGFFQLVKIHNLKINGTYASMLPQKTGYIEA